MKPSDRNEILGLGILAVVMTGMMVSGHPISAASSSLVAACSLSFSGNLTSLQMSPLGAWRMTSSVCGVTDQSNGATSGTFSGNFTSDVFSGMVTGTWSTDGRTQKVVASNTDFTLSVSTDQVVGKVPGLGSAYQGMLSGTGAQAMLSVGTVGQVNIK
jgi:hypothetical protein